MHATLPPFFWPLGEGAEPPAPPPAAAEVLGHDGAAYFVVRADGSVASVNPSSTLDTCFVNSTAALFRASLDALADRAPRLTSTDAEVALDAVQSLRHELNRLDIACLGDRDNWWAVVLDRHEDALP